VTVPHSHPPVQRLTVTCSVLASHHNIPTNFISSQEQVDGGDSVHYWLTNNALSLSQDQQQHDAG
jgi:hypothetical protein